jgi:hypothetical protein
MCLAELGPQDTFRCFRGIYKTWVAKSLGKRFIGISSAGNTVDFPFPFK